VAEVPEGTLVEVELEAALIVAVQMQVLVAVVAALAADQSQLPGA
jgi:hypothetical protein